MTRPLSPTMARSLANLGEVPVGDWLMALNARGIHALSTYALQRRELIEKVRVPCDPDGCNCPGNFTPDKETHPAPHYAITDAGREVLR